jgi:mannosyltransferase OCH1-like enzyme
MGDGYGSDNGDRPDSPGAALESLRAGEAEVESDIRDYFGADFLREKKADAKFQDFLQALIARPSLFEFIKKNNLKAFIADGHYPFLLNLLTDASVQLEPDALAPYRMRFMGFNQFTPEEREQFITPLVVGDMLDKLSGVSKNVLEAVVEYIIEQDVTPSRPGQYALVLRELLTRINNQAVCENLRRHLVANNYFFHFDSPNQINDTVKFLNDLSLDAFDALMDELSGSGAIVVVQAFYGCCRDTLELLSSDKKEKLIQVCDPGRLAKRTPKVIHFIWAGGDKPFPNHDVIERWQQANPDFQIILWVDKESTPNVVFDEYERQHHYQFADKDSVDAIMKRQKRETDNTPKPIVYADISENELVLPHVRYEIDRFVPNYGCSSDLLRYIILEKYGGAYFDSDVEPGKRRLVDAQYYDFSHGDDQINLIDNTQGLKDEIGNDVIVCSAAHPFMRALIFGIVNENYKVNADTYDSPSLISEFGRKRSTIIRTGPTAIIAILRQLSAGQLTIEKERLLDKKTYQAHDGNDLNWMHARRTACQNADEALTVARNSMDFEHDVMHMVRYRAHLRDIKLSLQENLTRVLVRVTQAYLLEGDVSFDTEQPHESESAAVEAMLEYVCRLAGGKTHLCLFTNIVSFLKEHIPKEALMKNGEVAEPIKVMLQRIVLDVQQNDKVDLSDDVRERSRLNVLANELVRAGYVRSIYQHELKMQLPNELLGCLRESAEAFRAFDPTIPDYGEDAVVSMEDLCDFLDRVSPRTIPADLAEFSGVDRALSDSLFEELRGFENLEQSQFASEDADIRAAVLESAQATAISKRT